MFVTSEQREPREYVPLRIDSATRARVRELADIECEGNLSMMLRRLIREALDARTEVPR